MGKGSKESSHYVGEQGLAEAPGFFSPLFLPQSHLQEEAT